MLCWHRVSWACTAALRILGGRSREGISNCELSIDRLTIMKIFGIESGASCFQRSGNDQGVGDVVAMLLCNFEGRLGHFDGDRARRRTANPKGIQRFRHLTPGHQDFSSSDRNKFVQDLYAEYSP